MEQLIKQLHDQSDRPSPAKVRELEKQIQKLQRDRSGWSAGIDLLHSDDPLIRFYGALTLTIKINADWDKDNIRNNETLKQELLQHLVHQYASLTNLPDAQFVLRKLCSTLVAFFLQLSSGWRLPVRHILAALLENEAVSQEKIRVEPSQPIETFVSTKAVNYHQFRGGLWFCLSLVEDVLRFDLKGIEGSNLSDKVIENGNDVWPLLSLSFRSLHQRLGTIKANSTTVSENTTTIQTDELLDLVKETSLPTALAWLKFAALEKFEHNPTTIKHIDDSISFIVLFFQYPVLADAVLEVVMGLAQCAPLYFQRIPRSAIKSMIKSNQAQLWMESLHSGDFTPEGLHYAEFLVSLVELEDLSSPEYIINHRLDDVISSLQLLLRCEGAAGVDDGVCQMVLEAFSQIAEGFTEWNEVTSVDSTMRDMIVGICRDCIEKVQFPEEEMSTETETWDPSDRSKFKDFRNDVEDFLQSAFSILGAPLLEMIVNSILSSSTRKNWQAFEGGLFCFSAFSEIVSESANVYDNFASTVFATSGWQNIAHNIDAVPNRVRQGAINFIARNTAYLQRHRQHLVPCLNFLFSSLKLQASTTASSRAIYTLCDTQRASFVEALPQFINTLANLPAVPSDDKHRIYSAVSAVIQAVPDENGKVEPLLLMLEVLSKDLDMFLSQADDQETDILPTGLDILESLAAIGKGLRAPVDKAIELDSGENEASDFWINGAGQRVQLVALEIFNTLINIPNLRMNGQITEAACDFIKAGYTEQDPAPFKFSYTVSVEFFASKISLSTPSLNTVMSTASAFLASVKLTDSDNHLPFLIEAMVIAQRTLLANYEAEQQYSDHEFTYSSLDFLSRLLPKWGSQFFNMPNLQEMFQIILEFGLLALENPDTLPRRSSAGFWATLFDLSGYPSVLPAVAVEILTSGLQAYAGRFTATLVRLLGGECARSELDALTEPLKKFVTKKAQMARVLLREAVKEGAGVLTARALDATSQEERMRFVAKVESLRGARRTNEVVKEFWVACRGSAFGYTA